MTAFISAAAFVGGQGLDKFEGFEPEVVMVKSGQNVTLHCGTPGVNGEWFFCLWKHPTGGKECSVQVNSTSKNMFIQINNLMF